MTSFRWFRFGYLIKTCSAHAHNSMPVKVHTLMVISVAGLKATEHLDNALGCNMTLLSLENMENVADDTLTNMMHALATPQADAHLYDSLSAAISHGSISALKGLLSQPYTAASINPIARHGLYALTCNYFIPGGSTTTFLRRKTTQCLAEDFQDPQLQTSLLALEYAAGPLNDLTLVKWLLRKFRLGSARDLLASMQSAARYGSQAPLEHLLQVPGTQWQELQLAPLLQTAAAHGSAANTRCILQSIPAWSNQSLQQALLSTSRAAVAELLLGSRLLAWTQEELSAALDAAAAKNRISVMSVLIELPLLRGNTEALAVALQSAAAAGSGATLSLVLRSPAVEFWPKAVLLTAMSRASRGPTMHMLLSARNSSQWQASELLALVKAAVQLRDLQLLEALLSFPGVHWIDDLLAGSLTAVAKDGRISAVKAVLKALPDGGNTLLIRCLGSTNDVQVMRALVNPGVLTAKLRGASFAQDLAGLLIAAAAKGGENFSILLARSGVQWGPKLLVAALLAAAKSRYCASSGHVVRELLSVPGMGWQPEQLAGAVIAAAAAGNEVNNNNIEMIRALLGASEVKWGPPQLAAMLMAAAGGAGCDSVEIKGDQLHELLHMKGVQWEVELLAEAVLAAAKSGHGRAVYVVHQLLDKAEWTEQQLQQFWDAAVAGGCTQQVVEAIRARLPHG